MIIKPNKHLMSGLQTLATCVQNSIFSSRKAREDFPK